MQAGWGLSADTQYLRIGAERMPGSEGRGGRERYILRWLLALGGFNTAWSLACWSRLRNCFRSRLTSLSTSLADVALNRLSALSHGYP